MSCHVMSSYLIHVSVRYFRYLEEGYFIGGRGTAELVTVCAFGASLMLVCMLWNCSIVV